jgi:hypothetical protein
MGFGVDLSDRTDLQIQSALERATQSVNTYCAVPVTPAQHDFRGGTVVAEQHRWPIPDLSWTNAGTRRVYPLHAPVKTINSFVVKFTNSYQVVVDPSNLYVNKIGNWAEVVAIAAVVSGVYPVGINFGLYTPIVELGYDYGWEFSTTERVYPSDSTVVYQAANQFWLEGSTPSVTVNGSTQSATYDFTEGTVTFVTSLDDSDVVQLDYTYTLPSAIAQATGHLAAAAINESLLVEKGLGNLASIRVEEVELRRSYYPTQANTRTYVETVAPAAAAYLADFTYVTVR